MSATFEKATAEERARSILEEVVWKDARRVGGTPCFRGSRVPIQNLVDCLGGGYTLDRFLEGFPTVEREQAERTLDVLAPIANTVPFEKGGEGQGLGEPGGARVSEQRQRA